MSPVRYPVFDFTDPVLSCLAMQGSAIGREYPEEKAKDNPRAILKDLNFLSRDRVFALGPEKKALFEEQLRRDTELMQRLGIMDYSLLTGIHNLQRGNVDNLRDGMLTVFQVSARALSESIHHERTTYRRQS